MNETNKCEYIINLYTRNKNKINPNNTVGNELDYILTNITKQDNDIIYLYKFTTGNKYYVVNSDDPTIVSTDDIMFSLNISRGNTSMNIRALIDWGIVSKEYKPGDRKEYFISQKDIWELARQVAAERKKRELDPVMRILEQVSQAEGGQTEEGRELKKVTGDISKFVNSANSMLDRFVRADENWFYKSVIKLMK